LLGGELNAELERAPAGGMRGTGVADGLSAAPHR